MKYKKYIEKKIYTYNTSLDIFREVLYVYINTRLWLGPDKAAGVDVIWSRFGSTSIVRRMTTSCTDNSTHAPISQSP